jgi:heme oxygenase
MLGQEQMEHFVEQYDLKTVQPKPEYEAKLMKVKEDLARMGVPYK